MPVQIKKRSGVHEVFNPDKLFHSMRSAGVEHSVAEEVIRMLNQDSQVVFTTEDLHRRTAQLLLTKHAASAARYNLKQAMMSLGSTGYPFEQFIAQILAAEGYSTQTNQLIRGRCVTHEIDVIARQDHRHYLVECKHHQFAGSKTDIKVMLYVYARFLDVQQAWQAQEQGSFELHKPWVITNTKVTSESIQYAQCNNMLLTAWHYPANQGLNHLIERHRIYPVTALPQLTHQEVQILLDKNIVTTSQLLQYTVDRLVRETKIRRNVLEEILSLAHELTRT